MEYIIRQETEQDHPAIYDLIRTAFETAKVSDGDEQDFAVNLRNNSKLYIPELALVAEEGGKLIGHIMLTNTYITQPDGSRLGDIRIGCSAFGRPGISKQGYRRRTYAGRSETRQRDGI